MEEDEQAMVDRLQDFHEFTMYTWIEDSGELSFYDKQDDLGLRYPIVFGVDIHRLDIEDINIIQGGF